MLTQSVSHEVECSCTEYKHLPSPSAIGGLGGWCVSSETTRNPAQVKTGNPPPNLDTQQGPVRSEGSSETKVACKFRIQHSRMLLFEHKRHETKSVPCRISEPMWKLVRNSRQITRYYLIYVYAVLIVVNTILGIPTLSMFNNRWE